MSMLQILRFEFNYQLRRPLTGVYFFLSGTLAYLFLTANYLPDARDGYFLLTAPIVTAACMVLSNLFWLLFGASVAGDAATRDKQVNMHFLTYVTPVKKADYILGRFLGALLVNYLILLAIPIGILIGMYLSGVEADLLGPFVPGAYLNPLLLIVLPNTFVATAIQFSFALSSRKAVSAYAASVILFVCSYILGTAAHSAGPWADLLDPMSFTRIMGRLTLEWTPLEQNTRLLEPDSALILNRMVWLALSLIALGWVYFRFQFNVQHQSRTSRKLAQAAGPDLYKPLSCIDRKLPPFSGQFSFSTSSRQLLLIGRNSFRYIAFARTGLPLLVVIAMFLSFVIPNNLEARGVPIILRTDFVVNYITAPITELKSVWVIIALLLIYYSGELTARDREAGIHEISGAAPVSEWTLFLGKLSALLQMLVCWLFLIMGAGILAQWNSGLTDIDLALYFRALFGFQLMECLLFAGLALVIHSIIDHKYIGHLALLILYAYMTIPAQLGIEHKLLIFGDAPQWTYTRMAGFGNSLAPWLWFKLYWSFWIVFLALIATLVWVRGKGEDNILSRMKLLRIRANRGARLIAGLSIIGILGCGGYIFYNTNVLNKYHTADEIAEQSATYESLLGKYKGKAQPKIIKTSLRVELFPHQRKAEVDGSHYLLNTGSTAIDSIHIALPSEIQVKDLQFNRTAWQVFSDESLGYRIYALSTPLQPGDTLQLRFQVSSASTGFTNKGADATIIANGTNLRNYDLLPAIGYQSYRELDDVSQRRKFGLPARPATASLYDHAARTDAPFSERIQVDAIIGTDAGQTALGPGSLRSQWKENGRSYFLYSTLAPIRNEYVLSSANYDVSEEYWNGAGKKVAIQIYFDPMQTHNIRRMMKSVKASMDHYSAQFGAYPQDEIRFVVKPGTGFGNHAAPINITADEGFFLIDPGNDTQKFDLVTAVVAHEVAHQWWGAKLSPARVEGAGLLSESLAWYSAMGVLKDHYPAAELDKLLSFMREENKNPRSRAAAPLLKADGYYQNYRKGPFVLYALSRYMGRDVLNKSLRNLIVKFETSTEMPTSLDLYETLRSDAPDSLKGLLTDFFERNTFWKLKTVNAGAKDLGKGQWQVDLKIEAKKFSVDSYGREKSLPTNTWKEVIVYAATDKPLAERKVIYRKMHYLRSAAQTLTLIVPAKPGRAGLDPEQLLIDWEPEDNISDVTYTFVIK